MKMMWYILSFSFLLAFNLLSQSVLQTFSCTGMGQTYIVPNDVCLLKIKAWGAGGGAGGGDPFKKGDGGGGGYAEAIVYVNPGDVLTIWTGCGGGKGIELPRNSSYGQGGFGWGRGGDGGNFNPSCVPVPSSCGGITPDPVVNGGGGGGSTAVFIGTVPIICAPGGGGGGGSNCNVAGSGGGGGYAGNSSTVGLGIYAPGGGYGTNVTKDGAPGAGMSANWESGSGGGGGGFLHGGGGGVNTPNCSPGTGGPGSGGGSGDGYAITATGFPVLSSFTLGTNSSAPANASDPDLLPGLAQGGTSSNGLDGKSGYVVLIKMNTSPPPVASISYNNPLCEQDSLKLQGSGGNNYMWIGPNGFTSNVQNPVIPNVTSAVSGNYTLITQSIDGCISTTSKNIIVKPLPPPSVINSPVCESSTLNLVGSGAVSYTWTGPNSFLANTATTSISNVTSTNAGVYYYFAQAANGCIRKDTHNVIINPLPNSIATATSVSCYGYADGIASVTPTMGTAPFLYLWSNGKNSQTINNLPPGTYTVRITDANNCIAFSSVTVNEPLPITSTINTTSVSCYNSATGSATISVSGGVGGYTYTWTPGGINSATANNLMAGNYVVIVKDANNCLHTNSVTITQPPPINISVNYTPVTCWGYSTGIVSSTVGGGTAPLSYTWLPINNVNSYVGGLPSGNYTLVVQDNNNCISTYTLFLPEPPPILINTSPSTTICFGQSTNIYAFANGGNPPYNYMWSDASFNSTGPYNVSPTVTTVYSVSATDANNCLAQPQTISINVLPPLAGNGGTITVCDKDTAILNFSLTSPGNGGPYAYDWHNGTYTPTMMVIGNYSNNPQTYTVTVSDGCTIPDANIVVTLSVYPLPKGYFITDKKDGCEPLNVQYTAISTSTNDVYQWTFETGLTSNLSNPLVLYNAGIYSATLHITNQYGCEIDTISVKDVTVYPKPVADFTVTPSELDNYEPIATFINQSVGATFFQWNFGDPLSNSNISNEISPIHYYEREGDYNVGLFVMNEFDCRDSVYKVIKVKPEFAVYIPDVFTPDGDGLNDTFRIKGIGLSEKNFKMNIINRWGQLVFSTQNIHEGWDGTYRGEYCQDGEYIYYIELMPQYSQKKNDIRIFKGKVFLFNKIKATNY